MDNYDMIPPRPLHADTRYGELLEIAKVRLAGIKRYWYVPITIGLLLVIMRAMLPELPHTYVSRFLDSTVGKALSWFIGTSLLLGWQRITLKQLFGKEHSFADFFRFDSIFVHFAISQLLLLFINFLLPSDEVIIETEALWTFGALFIIAFLYSFMRYIGYTIIHHDMTFLAAWRVGSVRFFSQLAKLLRLFWHVLFLLILLSIAVVILSIFLPTAFLWLIGSAVTAFSIRWYAFFELVFALIFLQGEEKAHASEAIYSN